MGKTKLVEIQQLEKTSYSKWRNLKLSNVKYHDEAIMIALPFRILVDNVLVYSTLEEDLEDIGTEQV